MTNTTNTAHDLRPTGWVSPAARIEKTEQSGWCAYLDIVDEDGRCIAAANICRGISSREVAEASVSNWVRDLAAPAQAAAAPGAQSTCQHRIVDARNPAIKSGYLCVECGALFGAADHEVTTAPAQAGEYLPLPTPDIESTQVDAVMRYTTLRSFSATQMRAYADATCAARGAAQAAPAEITLDFKMATELLKMFGGEPGLVTLQHGGERHHSGPGLYAWHADLPEEGAEFIGAEPDDEAFPDFSDAWSDPAGAPEPTKAAPVDAAVQRDADRYRWLRARASMGYPSCEGSDNKDAYLVITGYGIDDSDAVVDAAIDEARAAQGGGS